MSGRRGLGLAALSPSAVLAGALAVLVSYSGPLLIFQQASAASAAPGDFSSWVMAISLAAGVSGVGLSLWLRAPIVTAWSAPGTALLVTLAPGLTMAEIVGAYLLAALALLAVGASGLVDRVMRLIPPAVAAGMMAGILCQFGFKAMAAAETAPLLFVAMLAAWLGLGVSAPRLATVGMLAVGLGLAAALGTISAPATGSFLPAPALVWPAFTPGAALGFAVPLVVVTLAGQFVPGLAVLSAFGHKVAARPIVVVTALVSIPSAFFGGVPTALAAITAAICAGPEAHPDPARRYWAGVFNGLFYIVGGVCAGALVAGLAALPAELIRILAGFALIGAIAASLKGATGGDGPAPVAGPLAFLVTASGAEPYGVSAAFWGVLAGCAAARILRR